MKNNSKAKFTALVLVAILCVFALMNKSSFYVQDANNEGHFRFPASSFFGEMRSASVAVEKRVAAELAVNSDKRSLASVGRPANALETLRFGVLEGKYAVTMDGDRVVDLNFIDTPDSEGSPKDIGNRSEFLSKYAPLFGLHGKLQRVSVDVKGTRLVETYQAIATDAASKTVIHVVLDDADRLINLHAEKISNLKIF